MEEQLAEAEETADDAEATAEGVTKEAASDLKKAKTQALQAQQRAVKRAVSTAVSRERRKADQRVARTRAELATPDEVVPFAGGGGGGGGATDPRFSFCYEANDAGFGSYVRGADPEYDWYDDADNDGTVCEF